MGSARLIEINQFYSSILDNTRDMFIYLPPSYEMNEQQRYPVLYMHDGQHVFCADHKGESWDVHKAVDQLVSEGKMKEIIVVAISHVEDARIAEYMHANPDGHNVFHTANQGELYEQFLVHEVKPFIDREYRTLTGKEHTALMGSSAGGLVSYNIGFRQSDTFGMIGALCPFFVSVNPDTMEDRWLSNVYTEKKDLKIWMDVGDSEGFTVMEKHVRQVVDVLIKIGYEPGNDLMYYYAVGSGHSQKDWAARVHAPLLYFFGDIGKPVHVELRGPETIGIQGPKRTLNPVVHFDSGFVMTDINATYKVADSDVLAVTADGTLIPKEAGKTTVSYDNHHVTARVDVTVVPYISDTATVKVFVKVPEFTPRTDRLYAGIELPMIDEGLYGGTFEVPRDMSFEFRISRGLGKHETDRHGQEVPYRKFTVADGLVLHYEVENWVDFMVSKGDEYEA
ncbi:alpha/beta hydrolase-fold protein [Paenibacillus sp. MER TA 81-3]|uniref:alpha/beta hydrolase n=1 Tax=Paenibacillus sp. MER TA 81-3 TaxID=2939573 RepID=UPI00203BE394|nr:alpha/beta hydrolase-fold protein [Paenibacillus sp. MER TA 81-3]MCM3338031.1 alpha/beta hydrolase-fold protein [Paenibacillus sp. MER TA 81-3]